MPNFLYIQIKHKFDDEDVAMVNITKNASQW